MFIKCSSQTIVKKLDVSRMVERIGVSTCTGFHTFQGRGKVLVFWIMAQTQGPHEVFQGLGRESQLSNEFYRDCQRFACAMYRKNAGTNAVHELRYRFFCWKKGDVFPISYLPETTHFASMHLELTTRPQFGNEVLNDVPKYLRLSDVAGALKMAGWRLTRWLFYQPRKQFWNCCLANAAGPVSFHHGPVRQLA